MGTLTRVAPCRRLRPVRPKARYQSNIFIYQQRDRIKKTEVLTFLGLRTFSRVKLQVEQANGAGQGTRLNTPNQVTLER
jgi:hypothetical protein